MKRNSLKAFSLLLAIVWSLDTGLVWAAAGGKPAFVASPKPGATTSRVIVKMRLGKPEQVMSAQQRYAELSRPYAAEVMQQLQFTAGARMSELRVSGTGAHIMLLEGLRGTQTAAQSVAAISKLPNVEYAEEDWIETIQADPYYITGPTGNPGLWAMRPVVTAATSPASMATGNYGADFQTAWGLSTGVGVVVAVVDTGITPHPDIVGPGGAVAAGPGSNLISSGFNFITDCRMRGTCAATTPDGSALIAPSADASDTGDYITAQDHIDNPSLFPQTSPINSSWHGTHVAGTIAALGNNSIGVIGGAYGAKILPVRALGKGGGLGSDVSDAIMWAANVHPTIPNPNPAKVINLSLGSTNPCVGHPNRQAAINAAVAAGAVVVVAAGNDNLDVADSLSANCNNVISVAAVGRDGSRAYYSNFSSPASNTTNPIRVTLAAQGGDQSYLASYDPGILSTFNTGTTTPVAPSYHYYQGTSMATPHVSAAVALMLSYNPALTPARVKQILSTPAALTSFPSFVSGLATWDCALNQNCGAGILNANLALQNSTTVAPGPGPGGGGGGGCAIMPLGATADVSLLLALLAVAAYWWRRRVMRGRSAD